MIEERVSARGGTYAKEEDLRGGIAEGLRAQGELVHLRPLYCPAEKLLVGSRVLSQVRVGDER
jgi:hypothetical protein